MTNENLFDIIIVGGGLAGGLAAVALARREFSVALVDAQAPDVFTSEAFDGRTTAIAYANARLLRRLGLWESVAETAGAIRDILVTDGRPAGRFRQGGASSFALHFDSRELEPSTALGWIVENRALRTGLMEAISRDERITLLAPAERAGLRRETDRAIIPLRDGRALAAPLVIAADGKASPLRAEARIKAARWGYPQTAIVATVAHENPHKGVAQEFFLPDGPFAILPLAGKRSSIVWTQKNDTAAAFLALDDEDFISALKARVGPYLGEISLEAPRFSYPLSFHLSERFIAPRIALIGDAARAIHPIAGQGYNLGVKDIAALCDVLAKARRVGLDIGDIGVLENYQRWRRFDSSALAIGTDLFNRLFSNDLAPLRLVRGAGLGLVNAIGPARRAFMREAGGDLGKLPSLLQPDR